MNAYVEWMYSSTYSYDCSTSRSGRFSTEQAPKAAWNCSTEEIEVWEDKCVLLGLIGGPLGTSSRASALRSLLVSWRWRQSFEPSVITYQTTRHLIAQDRRKTLRNHVLCVQQDARRWMQHAKQSPLSLLTRAGSAEPAQCPRKSVLFEEVCTVKKRMHGLSTHTRHLSIQCPLFPRLCPHVTRP
jgi:hypothetical protein